LKKIPFSGSVSVIMQLSGETKFFAGVAVATIVILIGAVFFLSKPAPEAAPVSSERLIKEDSWATGSATPRATLVEFSDFECPSCGAVHPFIKQMSEQYQDSLRFVYRHFPLEQHTNAHLAAQAAEAAGAQGKFWEMHNLLFENQTELSKEKMIELATQLELDVDRFQQELENNTYKDKVDQEISDGLALSVNATPTFYLDGKKLTYSTFEQLQQQIAEAVATESATSQ